MILYQIKTLNSKSDKILYSVNFYSNQISIFELTLKTFPKKTAEMRKINNENTFLKKQVADLPQRIDSIEH